MFPFGFARTAFRNGRSRSRDASPSRRLHGIGRLVGIPLPYHVELEELGARLDLDRHPFEPTAAYASRLATAVALKQAQFVLVAEQLRPFIEE